MFMKNLIDENKLIEEIVENEWRDMSEEDKKEFRNITDSEEAAVLMHFGYGMEIRNKYLLWEKCSMPDDVSNRVIQNLIARAKNV